MRKVLAVAAILTLGAVVTPLAMANGRGMDVYKPYPWPHQPRLAASCLLEAVGAGAFASMEPKDLADYCIEAVKHLRDGYRPQPTPDFD